MMGLPHTWYLVMNTNRARILRGLPCSTGKDAGEITIQQPRRRSNEAFTDRKTRSFASVGGGRRSAVEPGSDPLAEHERSWMRDVQDFLMQQKRAKAFDELVVIGSEQALGLWRTLVNDELRKCVRHEFTRNLVRFSSQELNAAIRALKST
jgi:protein required for attachment to host cells